MKLSLNYLYFDINVMRKCIGRRLVNIFDQMFLQQKHPCWGKLYKAYYLIFLDHGKS